MAKTVQIGNGVYSLPEEGDKSGWGEDTTALLEAMVDALTTVQGPNDILNTSAILANNQTTAANIPELLFNTGQVEAVEVDYIVLRTYDSGSTVTIEVGKILGGYDGTDFIISTEATGDAGVEFSATSTGQFQYISDDRANHVSSIIRFRAKTIDTP